MILLSPAKTLDFESPSKTSVCSQPEFLSLTKDLIKGLSSLSSDEVSKLMNISPKLADLNKERFRQWNRIHDKQNSKQAILAFKGDVYEGLRAWEFSKTDFSFAQKHLRVLSGLYGLLKPLDLIQPYRLEMGTIYPNHSTVNHLPICITTIFLEKKCSTQCQRQYFKKVSFLS